MNCKACNGKTLVTDSRVPTKPVAGFSRYMLDEAESIIGDQKYQNYRARLHVCKKCGAEILTVEIPMDKLRLMLKDGVQIAKKPTFAEALNIVISGIKMNSNVKSSLRDFLTALTGQKGK